MELYLFNYGSAQYRVCSRQNKTADLVEKAFSTINANLSHISIFHTDRGYEFKNETIDNKLATFEIDSSLSENGCPYDNAVAEATFKIIKTEFAFDKNFKSFEKLKYVLFDYVIDTVIKYCCITLHRVPSHDGNINKNEQIYQTVFEINITV